MITGIVKKTVFGLKWEKEILSFIQKEYNNEIYPYSIAFKIFEKHGTNLIGEDKKKMLKNYRSYVSEILINLEQRGIVESKIEKISTAKRGYMCKHLYRLAR